MSQRAIDHDVKLQRWMNFGGDVPKHFDDHVKRSIPNYTRVMQKVGFISQFFIENGSRCLDIGSSTGRTVLEVVYANRGKAMEVDMVDSSEEMTEMLRKRYKDRMKPKVAFKVYCFDITKFYFIARYDLVVASLVIQFIKKELREELLRNIFRSLNDGGAFLWYEKCSETSPVATDIMKQYVNDYKTHSGLSAESVLNKDDVLRGIMPLRAYEDNYKMLLDVGFREVSVIDKDMNFTLFLAMK